MLLLEHFVLYFFLRYTGANKTGSICGAQTSMTDGSLGMCLCVCVCVCVCACACVIIIYNKYALIGTSRFVGDVGLHPPFSSDLLSMCTRPFGSC